MDDDESPAAVCGVLVSAAAADKRLLAELAIRDLAPYVAYPPHAAHCNKPVLFALAWHKHHRAGPFEIGPSSQATISADEAGHALFQRYEALAAEADTKGACLALARLLASLRARLWNRDEDRGALERAGRQVSGRLAASMVASSALDERQKAAFAAVIAHLEREEPELLATALDAIDPCSGDRRAALEDVRVLEAACEGLGAHMLVVRSVQREFIKNLNALVARLAKHEQVLGFVAGETHVGDASDDGPFEAGYLNLSGVLYERVRDQLAHAFAEGKHTGAIHPLGLKFGEEYLKRQNIKDVIEAYAKTSGGVRMRAGFSTAYDLWASPYLIVADRLANRVFGTLQSVGTSLRRVENAIDGGQHIQPRSGEPSGSHAAASGVARERIAGKVVEWEGAARWAREQAEERAS